MASIDIGVAVSGGEGPRVAVISGEPGIGKTRLADELYQACVRQGHAVARSRSYAGQGQVAYAPVAEWLRSDAVRAGWSSLKPQQVAELARLVPEIREQFPDLELLRSGPSPIAENWQRLHFYESLSAAFGNSRKPLLLYLDDMQWCDPDSFEWLNALLTSSVAAGILVLGTVRAEETGREHPFTRFLSELRQSGMALKIPLKPLDAEDTAELARLESVKPLESGNLGEIFQATRGNPLFVVESVRAGLQRTRVHAVIASRLAQLTAPSYELAGLASVVGRRRRAPAPFNCVGAWRRVLSFCSGSANAASGCRVKSVSAQPVAGRMFTWRNSRVLVGGVLALLGVVLTLLNIRPTWAVQRLWPTLVVGLGLARFLGRAAWIRGLVLLLVGIVVQLSNFGVFALPSFEPVRYWPLILVAIGLIEIARSARHGGVASGVALWCLGVWLQLSYFGVVHLSSYRLWPLLLTVIGFAMALGLKHTEGTGKCRLE